MFDRAGFNVLGNVEGYDIKTDEQGARVAIVAVWCRVGSENAIEHRYRIVVYMPQWVDYVEARIQKGTRVEISGRVEPAPVIVDDGQTKFLTEFVVRKWGQIQVVARGKPRPK